MKIRLRFLKDRDPMAYIIRGFTGCKWNHVEFALGDGCLGARLDGIKIRPYNYVNFIEQGFAIIEVDDAAGRRIIQAARQAAKEKIPYDVTGLIGIGFGQNWHRDGTYLCSHFVASMFAIGGRTLVKTDFIDLPTPRDLAILTDFTWEMPA